MKKIVAFWTVLILLCAAAYSDDFSKSYLTNELIDTFINTYELIDTGLGELDEETWELYFDQVDGLSVSGSIKQYESISLPDAMKQVFIDNGLGENGLIVYYSIFKGMCSLYAENIIEEAKIFWVDFGYDPQGDFDEWIEIKIYILENNTTIYPRDLELVYENRDKLELLFDDYLIANSIDSIIQDYFSSQYYDY